MSGKLLDIDKGWNKLKQALTSVASQGSYVKVGVLGTSGHREDDGIGNVELAAIQEFGAPEANIPSRPFIGGTYDLNKEEYITQIRKDLEKVFKNEMTLRRVLERVGARMVGDVQKTVTHNGLFERNAPSTIAKKGSDVPLVDTGRLLNSVSYEVVDKTGAPEK